MRSTSRNGIAVRKRGENFANSDGLKRLAAHAVDSPVDSAASRPIAASFSCARRRRHTCSHCVRSAQPDAAAARRGIRAALQRLEFRPAAKAELLNPIVTLLHERERIIEAQRTERRVPDQADADRGPDRGRVSPACSVSPVTFQMVGPL